MNITSIIAVLSSSFILAMSSMCAEDGVKTQEVTSNSEEKHIPAGGRALTPAERLAIQEKYAAEPSEGTDEIDNSKLQAAIAAISMPKSSVNKKAAIAYPKASSVFVTTHPGALHWPLAMGLFGEKLELEDGSIWAISSSDSYKILNWLMTDVLIITPNHDWFTIYNYRIHNQTTGVSVAANLTLYLNPMLHTAYNHRVVAYDDVLKMIWLEDGSIWSVTGYDYSLKWQLGDTVIIGINDGWLSSSRPNILINCNILHHVRANCLN